MRRILFCLLMLFAAPVWAQDLATVLEANRDQIVKPSRQSIGPVVTEIAASGEGAVVLLEAWGGNPDSLRAEIIQGIVHFVELYHGEYDQERLIYSLRAYEPKFIYAAGKAEKELRGVKRYVNLFYRIYNGRRKHDILPMKF